MKQAREFKTLEDYKQYLLSLRSKLMKQKNPETRKCIIVLNLTLREDILLREEAKKNAMPAGKFARELIFKSIKDK
jgi:hypothetical protein